MKKGEIWWASLSEPRGSEPGYRRPVVIVSADIFNDSNINTVLVAVVTTNLRLAHAPGNIKLPKKSSKLNRDSVVNVSQIVTVDKHYLTERVSKLNSSLLAELDDGLSLVLGL